MASSRGFSALEVVIGAAIIALVVTALASAWTYYLKLSGQSVRLAQAATLLEEGSEAVQYLRDKSWSANIAPKAPGTVYYLAWANGDYEIQTSPMLINGSYLRTLIFADVARGSNDDILANGGTPDAGTRTATISIYAGTSTSAEPLTSGAMLLHDVFAN